MSQAPNKVPVADFQTERLAVLHWADQLYQPAAKAQLLHDLVPILTPTVLAHLPPFLHASQTPKAIAGWIAERAAESDVYRITMNSGADLIGLLILADVAETGAQPIIHMGCLLAQDAWGQGYASEMLRGLLVSAQSAAPLSLIGGVARDNPASAHILRKLGFQLQADMTDVDSEVFTIALTPAKGAPA
ncbi:MAG: GNAT family N-acetyltransferase [Octadecabacter sp.]